jgi:exopolysaccharide production protein ExoQ
VNIPGSPVSSTGVSDRASKGKAAPDASSPSRAEWWFVYVVLVATALIPGLAIKYNLLSQTVIQVFWSAAYIIAGLQLLRMRTRVLPLVKRCGALWALLILMFASTLWSVDPYITFTESIELLGTSVIGLYIAARFTLPEFLRLVAMMFATVGSISLLTVFANPGFGREDWGSGPWQGIYDDKNLLGSAASLAIISQVIFFPYVRGRERWFLCASILLSGILLIGANSATAFINCAIVVVAALVAIACRSPKFGGFARFAAVIGAVVVATTIYVSGLTPDSVYSMLGRQSNLTGRTDFWPYIEQAVADRPVLGFGYDAFFRSSVGSDYLQEYVEQAGGWSPYHAHNSFLQTELDAGYVGLVILIIVLATSFFRAISYFTRERGSAAIWPLAVIAFLTCGSYTETYYLNYNTLEWILLIAAIVYPLQISEHRKGSQPSRPIVV